MQVRFSFWALLPAAVAFTIAGCTNPSQVDSISVTPSVVTLNSGQTVQLTATGTYNHSAPHPPTQQDLTDQVTWTTSSASVATVSPTGMVTAVGAGPAIITAKINGFTGLLTSSASISVSNPNNNGTSGVVSGLQSLTIIPSSITVDNLQGTGEFLAIATLTDGTVKDLTNSVTWISDAPNLFPISSNGTGVASSGTTAGIITAYGIGGTEVIAEATDPKTGSIATATATFNCPYKAPTYTTVNNVQVLLDIGTCNELTIATDLLSTLTIYDAGLNTTNWLVTAASATGTPNVIHCGPGSQAASLGAPVCTATYPATTVTPSGNPGVVLTATGGAFGGWSYNCTPSDAQGNFLSGPIFYTATGPNYCVAPLQVIITDPNTNQSYTASPNVTVGAIFN